ncbi:Piso0_003360 [Millerozyma farinosa CBS 7064]|uniref:Pro-apoptotic serine protease NMA111 n=1 Tax=Pichia sorbitophila (strain ATCC MYA-4447 / BCRC 22081 / CBS 7064 / NBRC 10061 / NRRL Y-12695) TaxID=559304 RepID=G8YIW1_PICSO|nr:Piso0_003360 [Millerozyma farinosa CBS 7064]CCE81021.1 Piso0_003360 [Millerozyma farinosa CBS 7064]
MTNSPSGVKRSYDTIDIDGTNVRRKVQLVEDESVSDESLDESCFDLPPAVENNQWQSTITQVVRSVVSIQFTHVCNFDTESAIVSEATGFIVDAARGLILTNRHVVGPGPFCGYVVFDNHEEAVVKPIYRDPIHDFGFLQYDPSCVKYMEVAQLELRPECAKIGTEIRVVGNDAGEKLSILSGFISRLDRNAPDYGALTYNDFNTEYIQAAASASGGSSGSPVVNQDGYAVALQAGGSTEASTDFFLPVYRPLRALRCIQNGTKITRGDIQVEWQLKPYDDCKRLGLTNEAEERARKLFPDKIGMLVAELILPEGPADGCIKEGDTLIALNDTPICSFIQVDEILDENVGNDLKVTIQRGGQEITYMIKIGDLHAITPDRYVDFAGASFNEMSYQIARCFCIPVKGVYINDASGSFELSPYDKTGWRLETVDDKPTPDLDTFIEVMKGIPDKQKITISYRHVSDLHSESVHVIYIERHWQSTFRLAVRNDDTGLWDFTDLQSKPLPPLEPKPQNAKYIDIPFEDEEKKACSSLVRSFVQVRTVSPIPVDSFPYRKDIGHGVIIDDENGFVLVSRRFVPHDVCDLFVIFAESIDVPGKVVFLHPNQNYAIIKYDPALVLAEAKAPKFSKKPLKRGEKSFFVGYNYNLRLVTDDVKVSAVSSLNIPPASLSPRYRGTNLECVLLDSKLCQECDTGILTNLDGTVRAFWLSYLGESNCDQTADKIYRMGLDVTDVLGIIDALKASDKSLDLRILDAEFSSITVLQGRTRGVPQKWISEFENACEDEIKFLTVERISARIADQPPSPLKIGDILLSVNGSIVKSMRDLGSMYKSESLDFKVIRHKKELDVTVPTVRTKSLNTSHIVFWCGCVIQAPHHAVRQLMDRIPSEVYVTRKNSGGPAHQYGIVTNSFITHVNDKETKDVDAFMDAVRDIPNNTYIKLRLVSFDNVPVAISLKTNYHYFPTAELKKDKSGSRWEEIEHDSSVVKPVE